MYSKKRQFGNLGEDIVIKNLISEGFEVVARNYLKKWGEIDIVARGTNKILHFVEVKTVSRATNTTSVSHETWRPEENVHPKKLERLQKTIESWLKENRYEGEYQIDVAIAMLDTEHKKATIRYIENII